MTAPDLGTLLDDPRVLWNDNVLRFSDTDANGHVNNSTFSELTESGRVNLFRTRLKPKLPEGIQLVIVRLVTEFRAEMHYPGTVRTATWVSRVGRSSIGLEQALVYEGRVVATAEAVCVLLTARPAARRRSPTRRAGRPRQ